ncbi:DUF397 domain-containing protein [Streptomyces sp. NPDC005931]|uniref:DUF397 domain-containing protein n=1 Tax=Streptomyces sp. NPDC005931 TaxID=3364737 RepID=UPI003678E583
MSSGPKVAFEPKWLKSSYSGGNATECVETAFVQSRILIRDSKHPEGPWLTVSPRAWRRFVAAQLP